MGIKRDAEEILDFIYEEYVGGIEITLESILLYKSDWDSLRVDRALRYLKDIGFIDVVFMVGYVDKAQNMLFNKITIDGIDFVERAHELE